MVTALMRRLDVVAAASAATLLAGAWLAGLPVLIVAVALAMVAAAAVLSIRAPIAVLILGVLSVAVTPDFLLAFIDMQSALARAHRLLVLFSLLPLLLSRGFRDRQIPLPIIAYGVLFVVSFTLAFTDPELNLQKAVFALLTLSTGWLASELVFRREEVVPTLIAIASIPLLSVVVGVVLQVMGLHTLFAAEYTGVDRLRGASIPAYLALMGVGAALAAALLDRVEGSRRAKLLAGAALVIIALSGTRGGLIAGAIGLAPLGWRVLTSRTDTVRWWFRNLTVVATVAVLAVVFVPVILARTLNDPTGSGIDASGRSEAWVYFVESTSQSTEFGLGLGSSPLLGPRALDLRASFEGVHNEYLRFYVEGGWFGFVLVVGSIVIYLWSIGRRLPGRLRPDFLAACAAFAAYSFVDNTVSTFQFFFPFGLVVGLYATVALFDATDRPASTRRTAIVQS